MKTKKVRVVAWACALACHLAYGGGWSAAPAACATGVLQPDVRPDTVGTESLSQGRMREILGTEFGRDLFNPQVKVSSVTYVVHHPWIAVAGRYEVSFPNASGAKTLQHRASKWDHFRTREVATSYSVRREGNTVAIFFAESPPSIMRCGDGKACDPECIFIALSRVVGAGMVGASGVPAASAPAAGNDESARGEGSRRACQVAHSPLVFRVD